MCEGPTLTYGCVTPLPVPLLAGHLLEGSPWGLCGGGGAHPGKGCRAGPLPRQFSRVLDESLGQSR